MNATVRVLSESNAAVSIPTIPLCITPGLKIEVEALAWYSRMMVASKPASNDAARFLAGM